MTTEEFHVWLAEHKRYFPLMQHWLGKLGLNLNGVMGVWIKCLESVELEDARSASLRLWELDSQPKTYERHPVEIKRLAKAHAIRSRRHFEAGRDDGAVKCRKCLDVGLITVFSVIKVDHAPNGSIIRKREVFDPGMIAEHVLAEGNERDVRGACVRCDCPAGEQWTCHPPWRENLLISVCCPKARREDGFWEKVLDNLGAAGANSTTSFDKLANAGMEAF